MKPAHRLILVDTALMGAAIVGALLGGLGFGPLLHAGDADPLGFLLPVIVAVILFAGVAIWRRKRWMRLILWAWTLAGTVFAVLLLTTVASERWPAMATAALPDAPHISLGLFSALDLDQAGRGIQPVLARRFAVERLDMLTAQALADHRRLLLAQPRLMTPEELVNLDAWVRKGGSALILADPLLLWPDGLAPGDRRRPPLTSLLDPLLGHWGLRLDPSSGSAIARRFVGQRLLRVAGASRFWVDRVADARCDVEADGLMALCSIGQGQVRLIADADMIDARLWRADKGERIASDAVMLVDHWLRAPRAIVPGGTARMWVRNEATLRRGVRSALSFGIFWAIVGGVLLWRRDRMGKAGIRRDKKEKPHATKEQL